MKTCPNCNNQTEDNTVFCQTCGYQYINQQQSQGQPQGQPYYGAPPQYAPIIDPADHTAEFDAKDISDNKVIAMLVYLLGTVGILIALLASTKSDYVAFHVRQGLKIVVCSVLCSLATLLLFWTVLVPFAGMIATFILGVLKIIAFIQICQGKAKEPAIIKNLKFLK